MRDLLSYVLSQLPPKVTFEVWDWDDKSDLVMASEINVDEIAGMALMDPSGTVYGVFSDNSDSKVRPTASLKSGATFWLLQEPVQASALKGSGMHSDLDMDDKVERFEKHAVNCNDLLSQGKYQIGFGTSSDTRPGKWKSVDVTKDQLIKQLSTHNVGTKDGHCFTQGSLIGGKRGSKTVLENYIMVFDIDIGLTEGEIIKQLQEVGYEYVLYSTHSHLKTTSLVKRDAFFKWSKEDPEKDVKVSSMRSYMVEVKKLLPRVMEGLTITKDVLASADGTLVALEHQPIPKFRVVFFLSTPYVFQGRSSQKERIDEWKERYYGLSKKLSLPIDKSCVDPGRLFYFPRHEKGREHSAIYSGGKPVILEEIGRVGLRELLKAEAGPTNAFSAASEAIGGSDHNREDFMFEDFDIMRWAGKFASIFEIQDALDDAGFSDFGESRTAKEGIHIQCPFEDGHTEAGGSGTYVMNASDNDDSDSGFVIHCMHDSCSGRDRLDFIRGLLEEGHLSVEDLQNMDNMSEEIIEDEAEPEKKIRIKKYSREWFEKKVEETSVESTDQYNLIRHLSEAEDIPEGVKVKMVQKIADNTGISKAKLSKFFATCDADNSRENTKKVSGLYAIPSVAEAVAELNESLHYEISSSKILRVTSDIEGSIKYDAKSVYDMYHLYANALETVVLNGETKDVNHFDLWLKSPDRNTVEGLTYQPRKPQRILNPAGGKWLNTYSEFTRWEDDNPNKSWDLMQDHIFDILCNGDEDIYNRFLLFFANIIQNPDKKYAQTLIIKGDIGCGKTIVMDYMREMLGKMCSMEVNSTSSITGKFNQHLAEKLFVVLDEGDFKRSMNTMKNLISSKTLEIEPKGLAKIWVNNCIRFSVTTNEGDTISVALDTERRFFVIDCNPRWVQGATACKEDKEAKALYFTQLANEMDAGGVDQMFWDLKNFVPENYGLSFATDLMVAPMTDALREESVTSTTPETEIVCEMVLRGGFSEIGGSLDIEAMEFHSEASSMIPRKLVQEHFYFLMDKKKVSTSIKRTPQSVRRLLEKLVGTSPVRDVKPDYGNILEADKKNHVNCYGFPPMKDMAQKLADRGYISQDNLKDL